MCERLRDWWLGKTVAWRAGMLFAVALVSAVAFAVDLPATAPLGAIFASLFVLGILGGGFYSIRYGIDRVREQAREARARQELEHRFLEAMADDVLTDEDAEELRERASALGLPEDQVTNLIINHYDTQVRPILEEIRRTKRYSPDQKQRLHKVADSLQIKLGDDELEKYRMLWEIEKTGEFKPVPITNPPIRMTKKEECFLAMPATWNQMKTRRLHRGFVGGSLGFRVAKGVTLRVGRAVPVIDEAEELAHIADGMLYFTSKKIVFVGDKRSTNITLGRLANYELFRDGVQINKTSGKPDVFRLSEDDIMLVDALMQVL